MNILGKKRRKRKKSREEKGQKERREGVPVKISQRRKSGSLMI